MYIIDWSYFWNIKCTVGEKLNVYFHLQDTQFSQILQDSLDFFNIPEEDYPLYFLVDTKSSKWKNFVDKFIHSSLSWHLHVWFALNLMSWLQVQV